MLRIQHVAFCRQSSTDSLDEQHFSQQLVHMFQAPELRERVKFCIRRDGCSYTFAPVLILSHPYISSSHKEGYAEHTHTRMQLHPFRHNAHSNMYRQW